MRVTIVGIAFGLVCAGAGGCGSVSENVDAGGDDGGADAAPDASALPPGAIVWARSMSSASPIGVAEGSGGLIVTGYFTTTVDLGGQVMTSQGAVDTVVAGLSTADASHVWSYRFGGVGEEFGFMDNVDPQGAPFVAGVAYGNYDLGQGPQPPGGGPGSDGFIGRYGPTGPSWVKRAVGPGEDKLTDTALGPSQVFAIGWYENTTVVDETTPLTAQGGREILLTRWNSFTGDLQLARSFGSPLRDEAGTIAPVGNDVVGGGTFEGTLAFDALPPITSNGGLDAWVTRFAADGNPIWSVRFGGAGSDRTSTITTDAAGDLYIGGMFDAPIAFGAVNMTPVGGTDVFVAKLRGADGTVLWAAQIGSPGVDGVSDVTVDGAGRVFAAATVGGAIEPGGPYGGGLDAAVVSFAADDGMSRWNHVFGTPGDDRGWVLGLGAGAVYFGLSIAGPVDLGGVPITGAPSPAGLVLKLAP